MACRDRFLSFVKVGLFSVKLVLYFCYFQLNSFHPDSSVQPSVSHPPFLILSDEIGAFL